MEGRRYPARPVILVDDERNILQSMKGVLQTEGITNVILLEDSRILRDTLKKNPASLVLLDLTMPYLSGQELLPELRNNYPEIPVIIITGVNDVASAVECMRLGAFDYLLKAIDNTTLLGAVRRALEVVNLKEENARLKSSLLNGTLSNPDCFSQILTRNQKMEAIFRYLEILGPTSRPVLITGETGTGKELLAEALHRLSRRSGSLIKVNVAGLDDTMFSDTLFGHRRGAFSGALENRKGLIESAEGGSLLLDEIGDLSSQNQIKLLRLLENGEYYPLGSDVPKRASCRIITATNRPLTDLSVSATFRSDLYYRLSAHAVTLPPLRERREDIPILSEKILEEAARELSVMEPDISMEAMEYLKNQPWPGNIRELRSVIYDALSRCGDGKITLEDFGISRTNSNQPGVRDPSIKRGLQFYPQEPLPTLNEAAELLIQEALARSGGNISKAAALLGISQPALSKRLARKKE